MVSQVKDKGLLLRPDRLYNFLAAATNSLTTDLGGLRDMAGLAQDIRGMATRDIEFVTVPNEPYTLDPNRVQWKQPAADALWRALRFDQPLPGNEPKPDARRLRRGRAVRTAAGHAARERPGAGAQRVRRRGRGQPGGQGAHRGRLPGGRRGQRGDAATTTTTEVRYDPAYDESGRTLGASVAGSEVIEDISPRHHAASSSSGPTRPPPRPSR